MRALIVVALAGGCASSLPTSSMPSVPSGVLDHEDPSVDTSAHPTLWQSSGFGVPFSGCNGASLPHGEFSRGCHGCAVGDGPDPTGLLVLAAGLVAVRRRRPSV